MTKLIIRRPMKEGTSSVLGRKFVVWGTRVKADRIVDRTRKIVGRASPLKGTDWVARFRDQQLLQGVSSMRVRKERRKGGKDSKEKYQQTHRSGAMSIKKFRRRGGLKMMGWGFEANERERGQMLKPKPGWCSMPKEKKSPQKDEIALRDRILEAQEKKDSEIVWAGGEENGKSTHGQDKGDATFLK